jgi:hypothetical protein
MKRRTIMTKIILTIVALSFVTACASIDKTKMNGKNVVISTRMAPVIIGMWGAPTSKCLADLNEKGVTTVDTVTGSNEKAPFLSRLSSVEGCQAVGSK